MTGDENACRQCVEVLGQVDTVVVKWAVGRLAARSLHPEEARKRIRVGAEKAVRERDRFRPFVIDPPLQLELDVVSTAMADADALMPGTERTGPRTLRFIGKEPLETFRAMLSLVRLAGTVL